MNALTVERDLVDSYKSNDSVAASEMVINTIRMKWSK